MRVTGGGPQDQESMGDEAVQKYLYSYTHPLHSSLTSISQEA